MEFSIAICTHNRSRLVCEAISSIYEHCKCDSFEVVVVNNASTDSTDEALQELSKTYPIRIFSEPRLGLSHARNTAIKQAQGDYIIFLDDDGEVSETWLEGFTKVLEADNSVGGIGGKITPVYSGTPRKWLDAEARRYYGEYDLGHEIMEVDWVPGGNSAWKLEAVRQCGGFNPHLGRVGANPEMGSEESALIAEMLRQGYKFKYAPEALMFHKIGADKLAFSWLMKRYYGQGKTAIRIQKLDGKLAERSQLRRQQLASFKNLVKYAAMSASQMLRLQRLSAIRSFMQVCRYYGELHGSSARFPIGD